MSRFVVTALLLCLVMGALRVDAEPTPTATSSPAVPTIAVPTLVPTTTIPVVLPTTTAPNNANLLPAATIQSAVRAIGGLYSRGTRVSIDASGRVAISIEARNQERSQLVGELVDAFTIRVDLDGDGRLVYGVYRDCEIDWAGRQAWQKLNCDESESNNGADRHGGHGHGGMHEPFRHHQDRFEDESEDGDDDDEHHRRGRWHHHRRHRFVGTLVVLGAIALSVFCLVRRCRRAHHSMETVPSSSFSLPQASFPMQQLPQHQMQLPSPLVYAAGMRPAAPV